MIKYNNRALRMFTFAILMILTASYTTLFHLEHSDAELALFWSLTVVHILCTFIYVCNGYAHKASYYKLAIRFYCILLALCFVCVLIRDAFTSIGTPFYSFGTFCLHLIPFYLITIGFTAYLLLSEKHKKDMWQKTYNQI